MSQQLTLPEVLSSKIYVNSTSGIEYKAPKDYINPFTDIMSNFTNDFSVTVVEGSINANEEGADYNRAYSRVLVEANLPKEKYSYNGETERETLDAKVGFIYALDLQKPIIKVFAGRDVRACTNLTIFNPEHLYSQELTGNVRSVYSKTEEFMNKFEADLEKFLEQMNILTTSRYKGNELDELNGRMVRMALKTPKLGVTPILSGIKELYDNKSIYALDKEKSTTGWNYYNAITENLKKSDIVDRSLKTVLLSSIILESQKN